MERFESKYTRGPDTECWLWKASVNRKGYGQFRFQGSMQPAHRVSYVLRYGSITGGKELDHICHNNSGCTGGVNCLHRRCVNPNHLEPVTSAVNTKRSSHSTASKNSSRTHCPFGHPYDEANTYREVYRGRNGSTVEGRRCITCRKRRVNDWCKRHDKQRKQRDCRI